MQDELLSITKRSDRIILSHIKPELFDLGRTTSKIPAGNEVLVYDLERTVCDMIRSRNKVGTEIFLAAKDRNACEVLSRTGIIHCSIG